MLHRRPIAGLAAAVVVVSGGLASVATGASAATVKAHTPKCFGKTATIVVTGNNKTVHAPKGKQHKAGSVIVALGKGDKVYGGDGNDKICVGNAHSVSAGKGDDDVQFTTGFIHGNDGNDLLQQVGKGNANVFGDAGNDKIKLTKGNSTVYGGDGNDSMSAGTSGNQTFHGQAGSDTFYSGGATAVFDGGAAADAYHIASLAAAHTFVVPGIDDTVNGAVVRVDAPTDAPQDTISYDGQVGTALVAADSLTTAIAGGGRLLSIGHAIAAPGRTINAWSINYGDGTPVLSGTGTPPGSVRHDYVSHGIHLLTVSLTDSAGKVSVRTVAVNVANAPTAKATLTQTGNVATVSDTAAADPGFSALTSYRLDYGDGSEPTVGAGAPPATFPAHTYTTAGTYYAELTVIDDHGTATPAQEVSASVPNTANAPTVSLDLTKEIPVDSAADDAAASGGYYNGQVAVSGAAAHTLELGQQIYPHATYADSADEKGSYSFAARVDYGDGTAPQYSESFDESHAYSTPGVKTITATYSEVGSDAAGNPINRTATTSTTVNVIAGALTARLSAPTAFEGTFLASTVGTSAPAPATIAFYELSGPGGLQITGAGAPPAAISAQVAAGEGSFSLSLRDTLGNTVSSGSIGFATANHPVVNDGFGLSSDGGSSTGGGGYALATVSTKPGDGFANELTGSVAPSFGQRITGGALSYGDGTVINDPAAIESGSIGSPASHAYAAPGVYTATLSVTDSSKQTASKSIIVNVAGVPTATIAVSGAPAAHGAATTFALTAVPGANAATQGYVINFGDGTLPVGGYGAVPTPLTHVFPTRGTYVVSYSTLNDHGATASATPITVAVP